MGAARVLLVDTCREFLDAAAHFLAEDPNLVVIGCVLSAREAVSRIPELYPDVVLLELSMPDMSGLVASLHIKALPNAPRVVIVTDHTEPPYRALAEAVNADGFVDKRTFCAEVLPLIRGLTGQQSVPSVKE